jgi:phosphopantothenoylcysteine decarboxylase / phosphopantothenate---cysteine ligase
MGYALAQAAVDAGAAVTLISGPVALPVPERVQLVKVESAQQMLDAALAEPGDIFIAVAAVADYRPAQAASSKIKKHSDTLTLELVRNPDILATVAQLKPKPFCAGFAAETDNLADYAKGKLREKNLDMIFANDATATFGQDESSVTAYWHKDGHIKEALFERAGKSLIAREILTLISANRQRG